MIDISRIRTEALAKMESEEVKRLEATVTALYDNEAFVRSELTKENKKSNISQIKSWYKQLELVPAAKIKGMADVKVRAFPSGKADFGEELSYVLGLVNTLTSLFVDEQINTGYAIVNTDTIEVESITAALGQPAYYSNKLTEVIPSRKGDYTRAKERLEMFAISLGLKPLDMSSFTEETYNTWFKRAQLKAETRKHEIEVSIKAMKSTADQSNGKLTIE